MVTRLIRSSVFAMLLGTIAVLSFSVPSSAQIGIGISVNFGPPALPVYEQPICPGDGYIWTPGYWAWNADIDDYYWVPGTWVLAPQVGFLWTPPWWGWSGGAYLFHAGWWGPHIGFYGGINYGFGYFGVGFGGGEWRGGQFFYNRSVTNINVTNIHNVYNKTVINNTTINRVSYNGGEGGVTARATSEEEAAGREQHVAPVAAQTQHEESARTDPQQRASVNHGRPSVAATARPGEMHGGGAVGAKEAGAPYHPPAARGAEGRGAENAPRPENGGRPENSGRPENNVPRPPNASHASEISPHEKMGAPSTGNAKQDQKFQQQQDKLYAQQEKEHQKLQQQQEKEHQQAAKRNANDAAHQQMEQRHQQQTQQMEQRHAQQTQQLQQREQKASRPPSGKR